MTTSSKTHYTTMGSVRGCCGHKHRTLEAAAECLERDAAGCAKQGGYSDRMLYQIEDGHRELLCRTGDGRYDYELAQSAYAEQAWGEQSR